MGDAHTTLRVVLWLATTLKKVLANSATFVNFARRGDATTLKKVKAPNRKRFGGFYLLELLDLNKVLLSSGRFLSTWPDVVMMTEFLETAPEWPGNNLKRVRTLIRKPGP